MDVARSASCEASVPEIVLGSITGTARLGAKARIEVVLSGGDLTVARIEMSSASLVLMRPLQVGELAEGRGGGERRR